MGLRNEKNHKIYIVLDALLIIFETVPQKHDSLYSVFGIAFRLRAEPSRSQVSIPGSG
jgi:hypothetical protein